MITTNLLKEILEELKDEDFEMLNEATLQNEIAFKLKNKLNKDFTIQLERNVNLQKKALKRDMDVFIKNNSGYQCCIEIKAPPGRSFKKRHTNTVKDISFLEQLKLSGYQNCFSIFISKHKEYINHFSNNITATEKYNDGKKDFSVKNNYEIFWKEIYLINARGLKEPYYYFILEV